MRWLVITYLRARYTIRCAQQHWQLSGEAANEAKILSTDMPKVKA